MAARHGAWIEFSQVRMLLREHAPLRKCRPSTAVNANAVPAQLATAAQPGVNGVLIGKTFAGWWVRAQLVGGKLEVVCLSCSKTYERDEGSIVRGESTRCAACAAAARKAG